MTSLPPGPPGLGFSANVIQSYYTMLVAVDWTKRGEYVAKHGMTPAVANEALSDPECITLDPTPHRYRALRAASSATRLLHGR